MTVNGNIFLVILYLFNMIVLPRGSIVSKSLKALFAFLAIMYLIKKGKIKWFFYYNWTIAFLLISAVSYFWAESKLYAVSGISTIAINTLSTFLLLQIFSCNDKWEHCVCRCLTVFPLIMFVRLLIENGLSVFGGLRNIENGQYNTIGFFASMGAVFAIYAYVQGGRYVRTWLYWFGCNLVICLLSMSRKSVIYLLLPFIIALVITGKNASKRIKNIFIAVCVCIAAYIAITKIPIIYKYIGEGLNAILKYFLTGTGDSSAAGRNTRMLYGLRYYELKPWFGWGISNYNYLFSQYDTTGMIVADNNFIDVVVNLGRVGLIIYYSIYVYGISLFIRCPRRFIFEATMPFALLITCLVCDYGVSSYIYFHCQTYLAIIIYMLQLTMKRQKECPEVKYYGLRNKSIKKSL